MSCLVCWLNISSLVFWITEGGEGLRRLGRCDFLYLVRFEVANTVGVHIAVALVETYQQPNCVCVHDISVLFVLFCLPVPSLLWCCTLLYRTVLYCTWTWMAHFYVRMYIDYV